MSDNLLLNKALELIKKYKITAYEIEKNTHLTAVGVQKVIDSVTKKPQKATLETIISYITNAYIEENLNNKIASVKSDDLETTKNVSKFGTKEKLIDKMELFKPVPYYNINVSAGNVTFLDDGLLKNQDPDDFMFIPKNIDADVAFPTFGHSMYPEISNGDRVAYKVINDWSFFNYGMKYLIITDEQRMVKYIKKHKKDGFVLLESRNKEFQPIDMPISSIRAILQVRYIGKIEM